MARAYAAAAYLAVRVGGFGCWFSRENPKFGRARIMVLGLQLIELGNLAHEAFYASDCPSANGIMSFMTGSGTVCDQAAPYFGGKC